MALAVVKAKPTYLSASDGLQQAKDYAEVLGLKFAFATNGKEIIEFDSFAGIERVVVDFPTPAELWARQRAGLGLADDSLAQMALSPAYCPRRRESRPRERRRDAGARGAAAWFVSSQ